MSSTKPYFIRALHGWCSDNGQTPYLVAWVDDKTTVPRQYVKNNEIVLNIAYSATKNLRIENDWISFSARFGGVAQDIWVPVANVMSIFSRETGEGMGFEVEPMSATAEEKSSGLHSVPVTEPVDSAVPVEPASSEEQEPHRPSGRPTLRIVK